MKKFNEKFLEKAMKIKKWSDRKAELEKMLKVCESPKLQKGDYFPLLAPFKKLLKDKHTNVIATTIKIIGSLAAGLRNLFLP